MSETRELEREAEAARSLLANIRDVMALDDGEAMTVVEGETNLIEAIGKAVDRIGELKAHEAAIAELAVSLSTRKARFEQQGDLLRAAVQSAMAAAGMKKLELPQATLTCKAIAPKAIILNEADIPSKFWKAQDPKLDRKAVLDALKAKEAVAGAELSNGGETIQIRWG